MTKQQEMEASLRRLREALEEFVRDDCTGCHCNKCFLNQRFICHKATSLFIDVRDTLQDWDDQKAGVKA